MCEIVGKTRQAYYKALKLCNKQSYGENLILEKVRSLRVLHPKIGVRKLHHLLKKSHDVKIGRDSLFSLLNEHNLLVKRKCRRKYFPLQKAIRKSNKFKEIEVTKPGQVLVSDITYLKVQSIHYYLALHVDVFSRKVVGRDVSDSLDSNSALASLDQAIKESGYKYGMHHSDGGCQYTSKLYQDILAEHNIVCSMTNPGSPQENAVMERINGILKHEYNLKQNFKDVETMLYHVDLAIDIYNNARPHWSLGLNVPNIVHKYGAEKVSTYFRT